MPAIKSASYCEKAIKVFRSNLTPITPKVATFCSLTRRFIVHKQSFLIEPEFETLVEYRRELDFYAGWSWKWKAEAQVL